MGIAAFTRGWPRYIALALILTISLCLFWVSSVSLSPAFLTRSSAWDEGTRLFLDHTKHQADAYISDPLEDSDFRKLGDRLRILREWTRQSQELKLDKQQQSYLRTTVENVVQSLFPFLKAPTEKEGTRTLEVLRSRFEKQSRGLVIPVGKDNFRFACHQIVNLRDILNSTLPIQIAYAGEADLPIDFRTYLQGLGKNIETFDVTAVFDDHTLNLADGGWAIKPFAVLGSSFEQALLLDADVIFLQQPETILDNDPQYNSTGTLLFHDRLIWQGVFQDRHDWWNKEFSNLTLSPATQKSKAVTDGWAEEADSGVVAVDKSRIEVVLGLLHICWQNSAAVREEWTYKMGYGDKESWWFGFELAGVAYSMEEHYASILGTVVPEDGSETAKVCSFDIAHVDYKGSLLWYNGSLLKNKKIDLVEYDVPEAWMVDGTWEKGPDRHQPSCMKGEQIQELTTEEKAVLEAIVNAAKDMDHSLGSAFPGLIPDTV